MYIVLQGGLSLSQRTKRFDYSSRHTQKHSLSLKQGNSRFNLCFMSSLQYSLCLVDGIELETQALSWADAAGDGLFPLRGIIPMESCLQSCLKRCPSLFLFFLIFIFFFRKLYIRVVIVY